MCAFGWVTIKPCFRSWRIEALRLVFDRLLHGKPAFLFWLDQAHLSTFNPNAAFAI